MTYTEDLTKTVADLIVGWLADGPTDPADLAELFVAMDSAVKQLQAVQSDIEARLVGLLDAPLEVKGLGTFERKTQAKSHRWDTERLLGVVVATAVEQREVDEDGEIVDKSTAIERIITEVAHIDYWRLQGLDRHGIDGRKYRSTEWGRKRVKYTPQQEQPPEGG